MMRQSQTFASEELPEKFEADDALRKIFFTLQDRFVRGGGGGGSCSRCSNLARRIAPSLLPSLLLDGEVGVKAPNAEEEGWGEREREREGERGREREEELTNG